MIISPLLPDLERRTLIRTELTTYLAAKGHRLQGSSIDGMYMNVEISAYQVKFDNEKHRSIYYRQPKRGFNIETIGNAMLRVVTIRLAIEEKRAALRKLEAQLSEAAQRINDDVPEDMKDKIKITSRHKLAVTVFCESEEQAREVMDRSKHVLRIFTNETYSV